VLERVPTRILVHGRPAREAEAAARGSGTRVVRTAEGGSFDFGPLELDVLWPPRERLGGPPRDPNLDALVLAARFRGWDALLPADAEQEATHLDPGPVDVLKVAHHGSDDAGLESLLERSVPRVALLSVGAGNGYGHPTDATLATLAEHGVCVLRTDLDGAVAVELGPAGVVAHPACSSR
jgi:competence protein ComEC